MVERRNKTDAENKKVKWRKFLSTGNEEDYSVYKVERKRLTLDIKKVKQLSWVKLEDRLRESRKSDFIL